MQAQAPDRPATWVLLRGLTREARHWGDFSARLSTAMHGAVVVAPDLPGNGRLSRQASPASIGAMVECCRADLQGRGLRPPYRVLALSMGGMVATAWSTSYPAEIDAAVLISTSMRPYSPAWQRMRPQALARLVGLAWAWTDLEKREETILRLTSTHPAPPGLLARWCEYARENPVSRRNALYQLLAAARFRAGSNRPTVPLLLLAGIGDRLVHPRCSQSLARAWGASISLHPSAGHDLPLDDPDWVIEQAHRWQEASVSVDREPRSLFKPRY